MAESIQNLVRSEGTQPYTYDELSDLIRGGTSQQEDDIAFLLNLAQSSIEKRIGGLKTLNRMAWVLGFRDLPNDWDKLNRPQKRAMLGEMVINYLTEKAFYLSGENVRSDEEMQYVPSDDIAAAPTDDKTYFFPGTTAAIFQEKDGGSVSDQVAIDSHSDAPPAVKEEDTSPASGGQGWGIIPVVAVSYPPSFTAAYTGRGGVQLTAEEDHVDMKAKPRAIPVLVPNYLSDAHKRVIAGAQALLSEKTFSDDQLLPCSSRLSREALRDAREAAEVINYQEVSNRRFSRISSGDLI